MIIIDNRRQAQNVRIRVEKPKGVEVEVTARITKAGNGSRGADTRAKNEASENASGRA